MKRLLAPIVGAALAVFLAAPAGALDYTQLEANVTIVAQTPTSVSILLTQTAGPAATLSIDNDCFDATDTYTGEETKSGVSGDVLTFSTAPHKLRGKIVTPDHCVAFLYYRTGPRTSWSLGNAIYTV